jgi:taurine transport system substrate-binding protein
MKKKWRLLGFTLAAAILAGSLSGCAGEKTASGSSSENQTQTINIGTMDLVNGDLIARKEKMYEDTLGVKVNIVKFSSGKDVNTALASGSIDVSELGTSPTALGIASGLQYTVIGIGDIIGSAESLVVKKDSGIQSINDLKGKKIATPFASTAHYSLLNALSLSGVNASDVNLLDMEADDIWAAWQRGDIDGAYIWYPVQDELLKDGGVVITGSDKLAQQGIVTGDLLVARNDFAKDHPELVTKFLQALLKANDIYFNQPETAYADIASVLGISQEDAKSQAAQFTWLNADQQLSKEYLGSDMAKTLKDTADFLVEQKSISSAPDLQTFQNAIDTSYLEKAAHHE